MGQLTMSERNDASQKVSHRLRFHLLVGFLALLLSVYLIVQFVYWTEENNTEASFYKIEPGMTMEEVQGVFGRPSSPPTTESDGSTVMIWNLDDGSKVSVWFNPNGKETLKDWKSPEERTKRSLGDLVRNFLRKLGL
jgi:hypothetical protein